MPAAPDDGDARASLTAFAHALRAPRTPDLPPLTGGLMGCLAYEAASLLDGHPVPHRDDAPCPPITLLVIDRAVVFDHWRQRLVLVAHAPAGGYDEAVTALHGLAEAIAGAAPLPLLQMDDATTGAPGEPNMPDERYRGMVAAFQEHILAGDIFQGVPSRRLAFPAPDGAFPIYRRLRVTNPAPYMFFLRAGGLELAGSSPEPLVRVEGRRVSTRPIAGTRPRGATEVSDRLLEHELLADPKERAEHAMLVICTQRPREGLRARLGRPDGADARGAVLEGDAHRLDRRGRPARGRPPVGRPRGHVPGGHRDGGAEAPRDGADRRPRTDRPRRLRRRRRVPDVRGRPRLLPHDPHGPDRRGGNVQAGAGVVYDSDPETELRETTAKAAALLPAIAPTMEPTR